MANKTIGQLTLATSALGADLIEFEIASSGLSRRITKANFIGATLTGGGTIATGGFTLTVPATGTAALLGTAQSFTALQTFSAGVTIEQGSTGDAVLHFLLTGGQRIMMGIDNSDSDKFKIGDSTDLASGNIVTIDPATNFVGIGTASPILVLDVRGASAIRHLATGSNGGITFQNIVDAGNSNSRMAVAHNAIWNYTDDVWEFAAIGANDGQAMTVDGNGNWRWIHHTSTGNTARTMTHTDFQAGSKMRLLNDGTWSIAGAALVGAIGTPASRLQVYEDTSNTGATAGVTIEQGSTGDAVVQFLLTGVQRWMAGIDNSVTGDPFVISSTGNLSGATFSLTTAGLLSIAGGLIAPNVYGDIVGATNRDLYIDNTGRIGYVSSSLRYKDAVGELPALYSDAFIERVQAISFVYKGDERRQRQIGFAAETVSELGARELVSYDAAGLPETVYYSRFVVPLWASHQRLLARVAVLEKQLAALN